MEWSAPSPTAAGRGQAFGPAADAQASASGVEQAPERGSADRAGPESARRALSLHCLRKALVPDEVDYATLAQLGPSALPYLHLIVAGPDARLAAKAAYLAGMIGGVDAVRVLETAARSAESSVRIAAVAAAARLPQAEGLLVLLLHDLDAGVRKAVLWSVPSTASQALRERIEDMILHEPDGELRRTAARICARFAAPGAQR